MTSSRAASNLLLTGPGHQIRKPVEHAAIADIIRVDVKCNGDNNVPE